MKKSIKIGSIPKFVDVDGRIKLKVGKRIKVTETYEIKITEITSGYIKANAI